MALRLANLSLASAALALGVLHFGRRFDQRGREARPIGANGIDFGLDRSALLLRLALSVLDAAQLELFVRALLIGLGWRI